MQQICSDLCTDPISISPMHSYAFICSKYAKNMQKYVSMKVICNICKNRHSPLCWCSSLRCPGFRHSTVAPGQKHMMSRTQSRPADFPVASWQPTSRRASRHDSLRDNRDYGFELSPSAPHCQGPLAPSVWDSTIKFLAAPGSAARYNQNNRPSLASIWPVAAGMKLS